MSKEISLKINTIRVISMFLIVLCHYFQFFNIPLAYWCNVGVQIFFLISGILYGSKDIDNWKKFWKNKFLKIVLPYYIVVTIMFIINLITKKELNIISYVFYLLFGQAFNSEIRLTSLSHLWFVSYIMLFYLILHILPKIDISNKKNFYFTFFSIITGLQVLQMINVININISYVFLFIGGYYFSRRIIKYKKNINLKNVFVIASIICTIGIPVQLVLEKYQFSGIIYKLYIIYVDYIHALLGIIILLLLMKILPSIQNRLIDYLGKISYAVYLVHHIFLLGSYSILEKNNGIFMSLVLIVVFSNILYFSCKYINEGIQKIIKHKET